MKVMLIHRYFWPDTPPYAALLRSIGKKLTDEGHEVVVFSSQPSYKSGAHINRLPAVEEIDGIKIHRALLFREQGRNVIFRMINMAYFPLRILLFILLKGRFDTVMASTAPPVVVGFAAALGAKITGANFFYHCMDIHPEIGRISGEFKNPIVFNFLRRLDGISCKFAKWIIVLSEDMKQSLLDRAGTHQDNIKVINNFSMPHHGEAGDMDPVLLKQPGKFRILFAGNLGRFQGLEAFIDAMTKLEHIPNVELVFVGEGAALDLLKKRADGAENVWFLPHQSVDVARRMIADADLGIVSLSREIYKYAYPSKTMTYLEEGCPLLVAVEKNSELVNFVESSHVGVWVSSRQSESIANVIESIFLDPLQLVQMKKNAKQVSKEMFAESRVVEKWASLFSSDTSEKS